MKHNQQGVILQRILKLICCGGFVLHIAGCGLKGDLYLPPEQTITSPAQQDTLTPPQVESQQK